MTKEAKFYSLCDEFLLLFNNHFICIMEKFVILKAKALELGLSVEDVVRYWWHEKELSQEFLQSLLCGITLLKADSGNIKVKMFYYAEDKTFSEKLIPCKQVSGVVGDVDKTGRHGLITMLHQKILPWSSDELSVGLPDGLNGKENTRLIMETAGLQKQKAEAAEYCANYALDGIQAGEAFFASHYEMSRVCKNYKLVNEALCHIKGADVLLDSHEYWTSSEKQSGKAMFVNGKQAFVDRSIGKWAKLYVCPVVAF